MPNPQHAYEHVAGIYLPIAVAVFALVAVTLGVFLFQGARRRHSTGPLEAPRTEGVYAVGLGLVVAFLVWTTFRAESPLDGTVAAPLLRLRVTAAQWSFSFRYPNGRTVDAIASWNPPPVVVPTGEEVEIDGTSLDVIHGFWVPALWSMRQLLPGHTTRWDVVFNHSGRYLGECSVYCGQLHSQMHFAIEAVDPSRFRRWLAAGGSSP
jgi:cytochrome c oxidase subunit 2